MCGRAGRGGRTERDESAEEEDEPFEEKFARLMKTGEIASGGKSRTGMMSEVAAYRFSSLTDAEVSALKLYLDSR